MDLNCFKAYDIRGRVPDELNEDLARRAGMAMVQLLGSGPVVTGRDVRLSSPSLQAALTAGIQAAGRDVIDIGLCGTEEVYFQTRHLAAAGGVMVTASHDPMDCNGLKLVREDTHPISGDSGLFTIRDYAADNGIGEATPMVTFKFISASFAGICEDFFTWFSFFLRKPMRRTALR